PVAVETENAPVEHRHDEELSVGKPSETRRLLLDLGDRLSGAVGIHRDDALVVLVREPQSAVVPARTLGKRETVEDDRDRSRCHGAGPYSPSGRVACVGLTSSSERAAGSGSNGTTNSATRSEPTPVRATERPSPPSASDRPPATTRPVAEPSTAMT